MQTELAALSVTPLPFQPQDKEDSWRFPTLVCGIWKRSWAKVTWGCRIYFSTRKLLTTEKTPDTPLARIFARSLSPWVDTTPSSVTLPFSTIM